MLWEHLIGPVHQRLAALGLGEGAPVLLIAPGGMNLLPLHAAWREVNGAKRHFLDDYTVSYGPSGYALHVSERRLEDSKRQQYSLLAVVNPTADLVFASSEGEAVSALFKDYPRRSLPAADASVDSVIRLAPGKTHLHFACHGYYDWRNPMNSALVLADRVPLTLSQVFSMMDFSAARLAVLSACETGITEIGQSPDEFLGFPAGFLQAGAPAVMSTLWAVDDFSTTLLVEAFYARHLKPMAPPAALRESQQEVRGMTVSDVAAHAKTAYESAAEENQAGLLEQFLYYQALAKSNPGLRPFEHPYYWAAFTVNGM
jgi:CHAT domain-containing protein